MTDMFVIGAERKEVTSEFPIVKDWVKQLKKLKLNEGKFKKNEVEFYYSYGFFVPKSKNNQEEYDRSLELAMAMLYPERLQLELSKVRVNISIKLDNFIITDRLPKGTIPSKVKDIVAEVTKVKMMLESEHSQNKEVIASIPALDKTVADIEVVRNSAEAEESSQEEETIEETSFSIDSILDKISKNGYESLSEEEKDFLDKKSKNM